MDLLSWLLAASLIGYWGMGEVYSALCSCKEDNLMTPCWMKAEKLPYVGVQYWKLMALMAGN